MITSHCYGIMHTTEELNTVPEITLIAKGNNISQQLYAD